MSEVSIETKKQNRFILYIDKIPAYLINYVNGPILKSMDPNAYLSNSTAIGELYFTVRTSVSDTSIENTLREYCSPLTTALPVTLKHLDAFGYIIGQWDIVGKISRVDFGTHNWDSDDSIEYGVSVDILTAEYTVPKKETE